MCKKGMSILLVCSLVITILPIYLTSSPATVEAASADVMGWEGNPDFSVDDLTEEEKVWYDRFWASLENADSWVQLSDAGSGDMHQYARGLHLHLQAMLSAFRATGDLAILDRVDEFTQEMRGALGDYFVDNQKCKDGTYCNVIPGSENGYLNWRYLNEAWTDAGYFGNDGHWMDTIFAHSLVAHFAYAFRANEHLSSPGGVDYGERASFWQGYMEDDFFPRFRDKFNAPTGFPIYVRMFNHTYAAQIGMYHYMYLMTEDTGYRDERDRMAGHLKEEFKEITVDDEVGVLWNHGHASDPSESVILSVQNAQYTTYFRYTMGFTANLAFERIAPLADPALIHGMGVSFRKFANDGDPDNTGKRYAEDIAGAVERTLDDGTIMAINEGRDRDTANKLGASNFGLVAPFDTSGEILKELLLLHEITEADVDNPRRVNLPASILVALIAGDTYQIILDVKDLSASVVTENKVNLTWTAPGEGGMESTADYYDIRYSTSEITKANWSNATAITNAPTPGNAGALEDVTVDGLGAGTTYYFAMKASDQDENESVLSNVVNITTPLLLDSFDDHTTGTAPSGWLIDDSSDTSVNVVEIPSDLNKSMLLDDDSVPSFAEASRSFDPQEGTLNTKWSFMTEDTEAFNRFELTDSSDNRSVFLAIVDGELKYNTDPPGDSNIPPHAEMDDNTGSWHSIGQSVEADSWYDVEIMADVNRKAYDIYIDGIIKKSGIPFLYSVSNVDHIIFRTGGINSGKLYIDDVIITQDGEMFPPGWSFQDVGEVPAEGSAFYSDETFTVLGSGADIWGTADEFYYAYRSWRGDGTFVAKVTDMELTSPTAQAGIMIRESLDEGSQHAFMALKPGGGSSYKRRYSTDGSTVNTATSDITTPYWVRLDRVGNTLYGSHSEDGVSWDIVNIETFPMNSDVYVGLAVTSKSEEVNQSTFSDVSIGALDFNSLPSGWTSSDIGDVSVEGKAVNFENTYTVAGAGDIDGEADEFHYAYQSWEGDGRIVAKIENVENTADDAAAGVMIRESLDAGSKHAYMGVLAAGGTTFKLRTAIDGSSVSSVENNASAPLYVALEREGSTIRGYESTDGFAWTLVGTETISMDNQVYFGLAVTSKTDGTLNTSTFSDVSTAVLNPNPLPEGWAARDIGNVGVAGSSAFEDGVYTVAGSGKDIYFEADEFHFAHQPFTGDGSIVARIADINSPKGQSGIMMRETLDAGSKNAFLNLRAIGNVTFKRRTTTDGPSQNTLGDGVSDPHWLKLERIGDTLNGYHSADGEDWSLVNSITLSMNEEIYVGLAVTAHDNTALNITTFDNVTIE